MNKYLEKIAELLDDERKGLGIASTLGGAALAASTASDKGIYEATGRHTYYHGTRKDVAEEIKKEGLKPRGTKGVVDAMNNEEFSKRNEDLAFAAKSKAGAAQYADQAEKLHRHGPSYVHSPTRGKDALNATMGRGEGEIVTIRAPKEHIYKNKIKNPEYEHMNPFQKMMMGGDHVAKHHFEDTVLTHKGKIGAEYIKESPHYKGVTPDEVIQNIKRKPGNAAKYGGRIVGGLGLAGLGIHLLRDKNHEQQVP